MPRRSSARRPARPLPIATRRSRTAQPRSDRGDPPFVGVRGRIADPADGDERRLAGRRQRPRPGRGGDPPASDSIGRSMRGARNGTPSSSATATAGRSSRFVRARIARVEPSAGQVRIARSRRTGSSAGSGARTRRPSAAGPDRIRFANRRSLCSTSRTARSTTGRGTPVVDLEIHASEIGQATLPATGSAGRRRGANRRSIGRHHRRGRSGWRVRPAAGRGRAATDPRPGPRPPGVHRSDGASGPAGPDRSPRARIARRMRSSKSRPPVAATARS